MHNPAGLGGVRKYTRCRGQILHPVQQVQDAVEQEGCFGCRNEWSLAVIIQQPDQLHSLVVEQLPIDSLPAFFGSQRPDRFQVAFRDAVAALVQCVADFPVGAHVAPVRMFSLGKATSESRALGVKGI